MVDKPFDSCAACIRLVLILLAVMGLTACTGHLTPMSEAPETPGPLTSEHLLIVTVAEGDTLESLAGIHLQDRTKAWWIAAYNGITTLTPGQRLVIPRRPSVMGGLRTDGYQTVPVLVYAQPVPDDVFDAQMAYLVRRGCMAISLAALTAFLNLDDQLPPKAVVITLEDSHSWIFESAYPTLKRHGLRAALFVAPDAIGQAGRLTWEHLEAMAADGFDIGLLGPSSREPSPRQTAEGAASNMARLAAQIGSARQLLKDRLKHPCDDYSYPDGRADDWTATQIKKMGFRTAFTRENGTNPFFGNPFRLKRLVVDGALDPDAFGRMLVFTQSLELR